MAYFWGLYAEFGKDPDARTPFMNHFQNVAIPLSNGTVHLAGAGDLESSGHYWVCVSVDGIPQSGTPTNRAEAHAMTELGLRLYERLKTAPDFQYAIVTQEADSWAERNDLMEDAPIAPAGLVLSRDFWVQLRMPEDLEPFRDGYWWEPYEGEPFDHTYWPLREDPGLRKLLASLSEH